MNISKNNISSKRVDIKVGFRCNNNCQFCAQGDKRDWGNKTTIQIEKELKESKKNGSNNVVFTGGEPSIRKDIFEIIEYAKKIGFKTIQMQTNGRKFYYNDFCKKIISSGMNEFSPAIHGHNPELHDSLTMSQGSFKQTVEGIKNIKSFGIPILTNTVITKSNYKQLPEIAKLLVNLDVEQFQFAFVHPIGNAQINFDSIVPKISEVASYVHKGLQIGIDAGIRVMAEAMPYCLMNGYEKNISEQFIPETEVRDAGYVITEYNKKRKSEGKVKFPQCKKCKYDKMCEGPWKEYPEKYGFHEFKHVRK